MRLWLNRTGEVSLREQLITQVELAILCKELVPGERLPSTRELARRFAIHANTASAAYRELEQEGWLEFRHGSGVFVRATRPSAPLSPELAVDQLIGDMAAKARKIGAAESLVRARMRRWLQNQPPSRWLVIEPDPELCAIVIHEMELALALPVAGCTPEECSAPDILEGSMFVVLPSKAAGVRKLLPAGSELTVLEVHPVAPELLARLQRYLPEHAGELIGIASRWKDFQRIARTMLIAAGLDATAGVVCDSVTALELPAGVFPLRFTLLDEPILAELRRSEQRVLSPA
jgi:DNA-binding transcriptional regulator YhcF (GntR family)